MPRPPRRVCLEEGLRLNLTTLMRWGFLHLGLITGPRFINWTKDGLWPTEHSYCAARYSAGQPKWQGDLPELARAWCRSPPTEAPGCLERCS